MIIFFNSVIKARIPDILSFFSKSLIYLKRSVRVFSYVIHCSSLSLILTSCSITSGKSFKTSLFRLLIVKGSIFLFISFGKSYLLIVLGFTKPNIEAISSTLFSRGVPVNAHEYFLGISLILLDIIAVSFLILCASSSITKS